MVFWGVKNKKRPKRTSREQYVMNGIYGSIFVARGAAFVIPNAVGEGILGILVTIGLMGVSRYAAIVSFYHAAKYVPPTQAELNAWTVEDTMAAARGTEARLATLESLNKQGLLTPEEYEAKRAEILGEL